MFMRIVHRAAHIDYIHLSLLYNSKLRLIMFGCLEYNTYKTSRGIGRCRSR